MLVFQQREFTVGGARNTEPKNRALLEYETETTGRAGYFNNSFYKRAEMCGARNKIPQMEWNTEGMFMGKIVQFYGKSLGDSDSDSEHRHCSLVFPSFMAVPFCYEFQNPNSKRYKYSGNRDFSGESVKFEPIFGAAVDAFAHHVVEDSHETLLLADLQGE